MQTLRFLKLAKKTPALAGTRNQIMLRKILSESFHLLQDEQK